MRLVQNNDLAYLEPQPRDGGAPNPSARLSSPMMLFKAPKDGSQPRDGG
ncbi:hypothetical protein AA0113_g8966 [Alternaria arborescens]|uniref:Uncharacterized protein n=2 Tax=Alternaria sect. Alternaria TaxID=2499237 RepID=A0A4Q4RF27_9PLEO|nr:hypothetical protein AA0111_g9189 [Alternaria arborescens]KAB2100694.1 hypothetical protein AG0111_0g11054 [Alternaria gaisen]RYN40648.1 hypothetical protein AA0112_g2848 [Alternaria arborescens]RYO22978.1 hypothetical protein AA0111_g9189 [Alternaria arborescens]RYO55279.1 hypothetical protein AA0113_g8966 [Alternaria arborescens]